MFDNKILIERSRLSCCSPSPRLLRLADLTFKLTNAGGGLGGF